jgi:hypothetical protein
VVDGDVKSVGKIPSKEDIKKWVSKGAASAKGGCCG